MSNLETARAGYEAWNRGEFGWFRTHMTEDVEVEPAEGFFLDLEGVYQGIDGFEVFWDVWRSAWTSIDITVHHIEPLTDDDLFAAVRFDGVGRGSGVEVALTFEHWLSFRGDKLTRLVVDLPDQKELELDEPRSGGTREG